MADYVQVKVPDKEKLADLIEMCKGKDRSMADFVNECGLSAATMSRIINGKNLRPVDISFLQKVYEHRSPDVDFPFSVMVNTNGFVTREEHEKIANDERVADTMRQQRGRGGEIKRAIMNELFERGVQTKKLSLPEDNSNHSIASLEPLSLVDFAIAVMQKGKLLKWGMKFCTMMSEKNETDEDINAYANGLVETYAPIFLKDAWYPDSMKDMKISCIFIDERIFKSFVAELKTAKLHSRFSAILVDSETLNVMREEILSKENEGSLFDQQVIEDYMSAVH